MHISAFFVFFGVIFHHINADITLRFEGRSLCEKQEINTWLAAKKKCPRAIIASVGLAALNAFLSSEEYANFQEGADIKLPGRFIEHCPSSVLGIDDFKGVFNIKDNHTYVVRLHYSGCCKKNYEDLKNTAKKELAEESRFCVQEIPPQ